MSLIKVDRVASVADAAELEAPGALRAEGVVIAYGNRDIGHDDDPGWVFSA